jgi:Tfp pilus assembly protein PilF
MESVVISAALVVAITLFGFWACKRAPFFIVGWLFFAGMLVPMLGIVQVGGQSMADRYLYLPMIGLSIICAWGAQRVVEFLGNARWVRGIATAGSIAVLVLLTAVTVNQLRYWHDTRMLFEHALDVTTDNALANIQLGYLDARMGDVAGARRYYEEAIRIEPTYFVAEFDLANLLLNNHQPQLAVAHYQKAFQNRAEVTPLGIAKLENNWGIALLELQKPGEAFEHFREAEQSDPDLPDAHFNLGQLFLRAARWNAAEEEFQRTLQLAPNHAGALRGLDAIRAGRASAPG